MPPARPPWPTVWWSAAPLYRVRRPSLPTRWPHSFVSYVTSSDPARARVVVLGCGTSTGVPVIGCTCAVCTSSDPRNRRLRSSIWIRSADAGILVDAGPDFRTQALTQRIDRVDAVFFTHTHADHVHGMDDLRMFNFLQRRSIACYADEYAEANLRDRFAYIFNPRKDYPSTLPQLQLHRLDGSVSVGNIAVQPLPIWHGREPIMGYRFGDFAYMTDVSAIPDATWPLLEGVRTILIDGLRFSPHPTHMSVDEAVAVGERLGVERLWLTHMSHQIDIQTAHQFLPDWARPAWDGLRIALNP
ncbi:MAG: MBL fold metallo-hydrolase [Candidatus Dadabacteria bacterium]|nr:MAG: MBL fold metallo-hydrolase [Candidatus Dadabacteria bacterium]